MTKVQCAHLLSILVNEGVEAGYVLITDFLPFLSCIVKFVVLRPTT